MIKLQYSISMKMLASLCQLSVVRKMYSAESEVVSLNAIDERYIKKQTAEALMRIMSSPRPLCCFQSTAQTAKKE